MITWDNSKWWAIFAPLITAVVVPKGCGAKSLLSPSVPTGLSDNAKKEGFPGCDSNLKLRLARQSDVAMWEFFADSYMYAEQWRSLTPTIN